MPMILRDGGRSPQRRERAAHSLTARTELRLKGGVVQAAHWERGHVERRNKLEASGALCAAAVHHVWRVAVIRAGVPSGRGSTRPGRAPSKASASRRETHG